MTRASELFYTRRSRPGRAASTASASTSAVYTGGGGFDFLSPPGHHHNPRPAHHPPGRRHAHTHRHDLDGFDHPLRRSSRARLAHEQRPRGSPSDRLWLRSDAGTSQAGPSSGVNVPTENNSRRSGQASTDRLPGSVLLARERLLERLRGVSLSGGRRNASAITSNNYEDHTVDDRWRLADASDWGVDTFMHSPDISSYNADVALQSDRIEKKPPGLTQDMISHLDVETYGNIMSADELKPDCSICLESFLPGDKLLRLPCAHMFHSACLDPWVRTCGDCPYCRKAIVSRNNETGKGKARD
ncbi:hypothetical protein MLD38_032133 [Melastoma candidum]|uniref:Uncharacterized protein n=1 Tax=Melastoma candidum TaxID=119954 RepID=A0ACB9M305_9MYRT|nr:hypothetical protein MLD38_032133 [Melastoma candidum]